MPATVQHVLSATTPDNTSYEIRPSHWNSAHAVSLNISATEISGLFSNANGISFGLSNSSITASHNALTTAALSNHSHGNPQLNLTNLSGTTASNSNGLTLSLSAAAPGAGVAMSAGTQSVSTGTVAFANSNGITFGMSGSNQITASHNGLTTAAQSNHSHGNPQLNLTNLSGTTASNSGGFTLSLSAAAPGGGGTISAFAQSNTTQSTSGTFPASSVQFQGNGGVSVGISNGSVVLSAPGTSSLSATGAASISVNGATVSIGVGTVTASATSNTTQGSSGTINLNGLVFHGAGGASVGISNGSVVISGATGGGGGVTPVASASNGSFSFTTLAFSNANNVTFGTSAGSVITASVAAPGAAAENNWFNLTGNTAGNTTASGSTIALSGGDNITLSGTNGSVIRIDAPASSSLVGTQGISLSTNGSTISISQKPLSGFDPFFPGAEIIVGQMGQNTIHFLPVDVFAPIAINNIQFPVHFTGATNSTGSYTISQGLGFYTHVNSTQLSRVTAFTVSTNFNHSGTQNSASNVGGYRTWAGTVGSYVLPPGCYVVAHWSSTTISSANATISNWIVSNVNSALSGGLGAAANASNQYRAFQGSYSATSTAFPDTVGRTQINGSAAVNLRPPVWCVYSS